MNSLLDVEQVRKDFPILERRVHGDRPLVYLDSAATSQKPRVVLEALDDYYALHNANVHRGIHVLARKRTACTKARATRSRVRRSRRVGRVRLHQNST